MKVIDYLRQHTEYAEDLGERMYRFIFHGKMHRAEFLTDADVNRYLNDNSSHPIQWEGPDEDDNNET